MKKVRLVLFFLVIGVILGSLHFGKYRNTSIAEKLKNIPAEEYESLEFFFRFCFSDLAYGLFGNKPMVVIGYSEPFSEAKSIDDVLDRISYTFHPVNLRMYRGWQIWKKYQHLFPMKEYAFVKSENFFKNDCVALVFVNKKAFLKIVKRHLKDFKKILGKEISPDQLLEKVLQSTDVFNDVLKNHQGLIGTVLGYGRDNAWLFHRREEMLSLNGEISLLGVHSHCPRKLPLKPLSPEELDRFNSSLQQFDDRGILDFNCLCMTLPGFMADPNTVETKQLKIEYEQQYRQIIHRYQKGKFLEITLQKMTSQNNR